MSLAFWLMLVIARLLAASKQAVFERCVVANEKVGALHGHGGEGEEQVQHRMGIDGGAQSRTRREQAVYPSDGRGRDLSKVECIERAVFEAQAQRRKADAVRRYEALHGDVDVDGPGGRLGGAPMNACALTMPIRRNFESCRRLISTG